MLRADLDRDTSELVIREAVTQRSSAPAVIGSIVRQWYRLPSRPGAVVVRRPRRSMLEASETKGSAA